MVQSYTEDAQVKNSKLVQVKGTKKIQKKTQNNISRSNKKMSYQLRNRYSIQLLLKEQNGKKDGQTTLTN